MNCFDCGLRVDGRFPAKWECSGGHHIDVLGLSIDFMKMGCRTHWQPKPKPADEDYEKLYADMEKAPVYQHRRLMEKFREKFQLKPHVSKKKPKQLSLL